MCAKEETLAYVVAINDLKTYFIKNNFGLWNIWIEVLTDILHIQTPPNNYFILHNALDNGMDFLLCIHIF